MTAVRIDLRLRGVPFTAGLPSSGNALDDSVLSHKPEHEGRPKDQTSGLAILR
jgi:hypothetical protein